MQMLDPYLAKHPFLRGLAPDSVHSLAGCAANLRFKFGQYLFHEGEKAAHFYLIRHGRIALEMSGIEPDPYVVQILEKGEVVGWSWFATPNYWRFSARALELTRVFQLDGECVRNLLETDHDLGFEMMKRLVSVIGERLDATRLQLFDLSTNIEPSASERKNSA